MIGWKGAPHESLEGYVVRRLFTRLAHACAEAEVRRLEIRRVARVPFVERTQLSWNLGGSGESREGWGVAVGLGRESERASPTP